MIRVAAVVEQCWHRIPGGTATAAMCTLGALNSLEGIELVGVAACHRRPPPGDLEPDFDVRQLPVPRRVLYDAWHHLRMPPVELVTGRVDIVHATGGAVPPAGRARLVATVNDVAFLSHPEWFTRRGARFAVKAFGLIKSRAAAVIAPSQATATGLAKHGIDPQRIRVAPLGTARTRAGADAVAAVRKRYRLPEIFVLWVGTIEPRKNLTGLLQAAGRTTSRVPIVLAGPQGWGIRDGEVDALSRAAGCEVIRVGFVPSGWLDPLYAAARVLVYPSLMEGFGLPVLEAMAQGTPVVTSSGTATEEVCADPASVVDPHDVDAMAAAIDWVVTDDVEHARRSATALSRASELSWHRTAKLVRSAYEAAVA
ncbi:glycosyltransferase family 4 protein [Candidatus Poriferisodalis sp.]|uniref:glycosyltransferase family 4 protein n=1 Tax=Candidatus Poriferisodalis sp. TaxID=3101277 RepID=UPI003B024114